MNHRSKSRLSILLFVFAGLLLTACGGGGSATSATPPSSQLSAPQLSMSYGLKQFQFTWTAVNGASYYRLLESADGQPSYSQIWQGSQTSYTLEVPLYARSQASYAVEACDSSGCVRSAALPITGDLAAAVGYVKASNPAAWSRFGTTVSLSDDGKTMLVGAEGAASLYIFTESDGTWSQQQKIDLPAASLPSFLHLNVVLAGNGNLIAAFFNGVIYLFERTATGWQAQDTIAISPGTDPLFQVPIFLSDDGTTLAAGVAGDAYIYARQSGAWNAQATLIGKGDNLALSADGSLLASAQNNSDRVEIYAGNAGSWALQSSILLNLGHGPALVFSDDGNTLAVGDSEEASSAQGINGDDTDTSAFGAGAVFVYVKGTAGWTRQAYIKASNAQGHDRFGYSIDLSADGNTLVVGAYGEDGSAVGVNGPQNNASGPTNSDGGSAGAAYVFTRQSTSWTQLAYLKPTNTQFEEYGRSVAVSGNDTVIAVGDDYEASASPGIDGDDSDNSDYAAGAVFLY